MKISNVIRKLLLYHIIERFLLAAIFVSCSIAFQTNTGNTIKLQILEIRNYVIDFKNI